MITFQVQHKEGDRKSIEVPEEINLNLMEVLKASDYNIEATCGGMALCATCYIEVVQGKDKLESPTDAELDMLDTLPSTNDRSRLACQVKVSERLQDIVIKVGSHE